MSTPPVTVITFAELERDFDSLIDRAAAGEYFEITEEGKASVMLIPYHLPTTAVDAPVEDV